MAGFGLKPVKLISGGAYDGRTFKVPIAAAAAAIGQYHPVLYTDDGTIVVGAAASTSFLGVLVGCRYVDGDGRPQWRPYWPAVTTATKIFAEICPCAGVIFEVESDGSLSYPAVLGQVADIKVNSPAINDAGLAQVVMDAPENAGSGRHLKIVGKSERPDYVSGADAQVYEVLIVQDFLALDVGRVAPPPPPPPPP